MYTVADLLTTTAARMPDRVAVIDGSTATTYGDLHERARRCATLIARQTQPGDRVAILLPRSVDALAAYFGAHLAAAAPVFIHDQLGRRQVAHIVEHAGAHLILTTSRYHPRLRDLDLTDRPVVDPATLQETPLPTARPRIGGDIAGLIYTSGSTGTAKGVTVTHDNLLAGATIVSDYLHLVPTDRTLALLPWSFDYGLNQVLASFAVGATVVIQRSWFGPDICRTLDAAQVTGLAGVPSLWAALTWPRSPLLHRPQPALRYITNSGGPLAPATIEQLHEGQPHLDIVLMYGLTEAFRSTYLDPAHVSARPTSIGKAIPNTEIIIVGDDGRPCPPGVTGQLVHRGPTVALGYWQDPDTTAQVFRPHPFPAAGHPAETVVYSGDYVRADTDGYLYYIGRRDELFKSRGIRVTTTEIETEIRASGLVRDAVVAAVDTDGPDPLLIAAVTLANGTSNLTDLSAYCRRELAPHLQPHEIVVLETMPTTSTGKTDRAAMRDQLSQPHTSGKAQP
ncbi:AMP-dependent synthetase [Actinoplanes capillaceus]|uniref:AMP-dependent synthetase n=1 Tax=Actinoplanes campanulatus TaxID=113559 RepID=A0ABQ3WZ18_9ACTN|nr:AMP-binding protein [Actinoplanes capillaceus]GID51515.1 AMP-dependent synthetase [Actinoplanes capillaceus]